MMTESDKLHANLMAALEEWRTAEEWWATSGGQYDASLAEEKAWNNYILAREALMSYMERQRHEKV